MANSSLVRRVAKRLVIDVGVAALLVTLACAGAHAKLKGYAK